MTVDVVTTQFIVDECPLVKVEMPYTAAVDLHNLLDRCTDGDLDDRIVWSPYLQGLLESLCTLFHAGKGHSAPTPSEP